MGNQTKVVFKPGAVEQLLSLPSVTSDLERRGAAIKMRADSMGRAKYAQHTRPGRKGGRPYVAIAANTAHAIRSNAKYNSLLKSIDAGRG